MKCISILAMILLSLLTCNNVLAANATPATPPCPSTQTDSSTPCAPVIAPTIPGETDLAKVTSAVRAQEAATTTPAADKDKNKPPATSISLERAEKVAARVTAVGKETAPETKTEAKPSDTPEEKPETKPEEKKKEEVKPEEDPDDDDDDDDEDEDDDDFTPKRDRDIPMPTTNSNQTNPYQFPTMPTNYYQQIYFLPEVY